MPVCVAFVMTCISEWRKVCLWFCRQNTDGGFYSSVLTCVKSASLQFLYMNPMLEHKIDQFTESIPQKSGIGIPILNLDLILIDSSMKSPKPNRH